MDITHQVTPFSIEEASRFLYGATPYYPAGTVFLVVVDPGVGTSRKAIAVKSKKGQYFILPDNGVITPVLDRDGLDSAREITNQHWMIDSPLSSTFHGRDIFSPAAAHLAALGVSRSLLPLGRGPNIYRNVRAAFLPRRNHLHLPGTVLKSRLVGDRLRLILGRPVLMSSEGVG